MAGDLHLTLHGDIPNLHIAAQVEIVILDIGLKGLWQKHVIDNAETAHPMCLDAVSKGRAPDPA